MTSHNYNQSIPNQTPRRRGIFPPASTVTLTASSADINDRQDPLDMILYCDELSRRRQPQHEPHQQPYFSSNDNRPYVEDNDDDHYSQHSELSESLRTTLSAPTIGNARRPDPPLAYQSEGEQHYGHSLHQQQQQQQQLLHRRRPLSSNNNQLNNNTTPAHLQRAGLHTNNNNNNNIDSSNNNGNNMPRLPRTTNDPPSSSSYRSEADETTYYSDDSYFAARHVTSAHRRRVAHVSDHHRDEPLGMDCSRSIGASVGDDDSARMMTMMEQRPHRPYPCDDRAGRRVAAAMRMEPPNFREPYGHERNSPLGLELQVLAEEPEDPYRPRGARRGGRPGDRIDDDDVDDGRPRRRSSLVKRQGDDDRYASDRSGGTSRRNSSRSAKMGSSASSDLSRGVLFWATKVDAILQFLSDILSFFLGIFVSKKYDGRLYGPSNNSSRGSGRGRSENPYHDHDGDRHRRHHRNSPPPSIRSDKWIDIEVAERRRMATSAAAAAATANSRGQGGNGRASLPRSSSMPVNGSNNNPNNYHNNNHMHNIPEEVEVEDHDDDDEYTIDNHHRDRYHPHSFEPPTVTLMDLNCDRPKNRRPPLGRIQRRVDNNAGNAAMPSDEQSEVLEDTISVLHMSGVSALIPPNSNSNSNRDHHPHSHMGARQQEEYIRRVSASSTAAGNGGVSAPFPRARTLPTRFPQGKEFKQTTPFVTRHDSVLFLHQ